MKTNLFFKSVAVMAMTAFVASCTQENFGVQEESGKKVLTVNVSENAFTAVNENSRVTDNGYSTTFDVNDKIGLIIVDVNTKELIHKMYLEKTADSWNGTVYYYENADYLAYYPYDEDMDDVTSLEEINEYFKDNKYTLDQSTLESYRNCDLMTASVTHDAISAGATLDLNFSHTNAMVEFNIPYYSYTTADENGYDYSVPVSLDLSMGTEEGFKPYQMAVGKYRVIIPAGEAKSFKGSFRDAKTNQPVNFTANDVSLAANNANIYNVEYDNGPVVGQKQTRAIQPGDYYYADGNIVPNDFLNPAKEGCIGIVFSTSTKQELAKDNNSTCNNGYVMALIDATGNENQATAWEYKWGVNNTTIPGLNVVDTETAIAPATVLTEENVSGLANTKLIVEGNLYATSNDNIENAIETFGAEGNYTSIYAASDKTTGWFLPTASQFAQIIKYLGTSKGGYFSWTNNSPNAEDVSQEVYNGTQKILIEKPLERINGILGKVGGSINTGVKSYWTSSVASYTTSGENAVTKYAPLYFNCANASNVLKGDFVGMDANDNDKRNVRLILAF